ncbi:polysaccharide lyase family 14 protein [Polyporus arcularius HHB13444]|uniref:Polysaccharide lyase family 14 protein n=1 Tax=Polyporus arcularius HHB13444 TaxID=1314778 RepID=A0A5C3P5R8_9APHY|nr:polysaccharide lyase family 14 protein [Polyporus arcularius HHB13444]
MSTSLFSPITTSRISSGFTTYPAKDLPAGVVPVPLSDKELNVHRVTSNTTHNLVIPPTAVPGGDASTRAWEALYPLGSINPGNKTAPHGGFGFYMHGPKQFAEALKRLGDGEEVALGYDVLFQDGFEWVKGGKLPGTYGGAGDHAYGCTGGRQNDRCKCFNLRLMWRENGMGELYAYLPHESRNTERLLPIPPKSIKHPDYGFSVGRGAWTFNTGKWTRVLEVVKVNTVGKEDGEIRVYIDGQLRIHANGLILRTRESPDARVQGLHLQTFFGGNSPEWASPKDQRAWFANVSGAILRPRTMHDEL